MIVKLKIGKEGKLLGVVIDKASGDKDVDNRAIESLKKTKFSPLPNWYFGESLDFRVDLSKIPPEDWTNDS
jgi:TonB family protein